MLRKITQGAVIGGLVVLLDSVMMVQLSPPVFGRWTPVTVAAGQTLWSLGESHCPTANPNDVVDAIEQHDHINGMNLQPGSVVEVPTEWASPWSRLTSL
ncbi:LysM domain-containing protein [Alicyclobacillus sp. ALC3]|uniref:LysM domain-containing protein n=1 Tax=Alicyclobacillus sp. ALC3 TaxID=2796143 RepID=UPI00237953F8|nr:LysM domain-containing protein [Alicyclobacillus sp. ALC3]WDL99726.1 LysM domain-containing protein [Alicyclobacillus sp. ALC3]